MDTHDFLVSLIKQYTLDYELSGSEAEIKESFRSEAAKFVQSYLEAFDLALEAINSRATAAFNIVASAACDANTNPSTLFELKVAYQITKWSATEENLQGNFLKLKLAYATKLSTGAIDRFIVETLEASNLAIAAQVDKATNYASEWVNQMESLDISAIMDDTRETIGKFKNLTIGDLCRYLDP